MSRDVLLLEVLWCVERVFALVCYFSYVFTTFGSKKSHQFSFLDQ